MVLLGVQCLTIIVSDILFNISTVSDLRAFLVADIVEVIFLYFGDMMSNNDVVMTSRYCLLALIM